MHSLDLRTLLVGLISAAAGVGCAGTGNGSLSTVVEALEGARNVSPFVEAHVQFIGPDARWAGPALWSLHVSAKEGDRPILEVTPKLPEASSKSSPNSRIAGDLEGVRRGPASALGMTQRASVSTDWDLGPTSEKIRERLALIASALQAAEAETFACSTTVRVRLARADGSVVERQGCRGSVQWSQTVSEFAAEMMSASRFRSPAAIAPAFEADDKVSDHI
jgi:hypothetical protein